MKKILLSLIAMIIATVSFAQNTLVATLTHGDEIKVFYGANAFINAHNAATDGDVINLSGGGFYGLTNGSAISKAITVRGTGVNAANPTIIQEFYVNIPGSSESKLIFEGCTMNRIIVHDVLPDVCFYKCKIQKIENLSAGCVFRNAMFVNCDINSYHFWSEDASNSIQFINCYVNDVTGSHNFVNCVIKQTQMDGSILVNCILYGTSDYGLGQCTPIWCVAVGDPDRKAFRNVVNTQNCSYADLGIFINSDVLNDLTDEAKETYKGNDGTPVGAFGGLMPYSMTPSYPVIMKMEVANKTTADGKLNVNIEIGKGN